MLMGSSVLHDMARKVRGERESHTYPVNKMRLSEVTVDPVEYVQCPVSPERRGKYWYSNRGMKIGG